MQSKRVQILILLLIISVIYSLLSVFLVNDQTDKNSFRESVSSEDRKPIKDDGNHLNGADMLTKKNTQKLNSISEQPTTINTELELPKQFLLVGTRLKTDSNTEQSMVLLSYVGDLHQYFENDFLLNTDMQLAMVYESKIDISFKDRIFTIALSPPNLLAPDFREAEKSYSDFLEMTPEEIGSRPRILEHLIILTPTPYIADGQLIYPGLNPALFQQAGFKEDDVLKTINGKSVTIEAELDDIKKEMLNASTLVFEVMRKGRMITLYLDIPSEALEIKR
ncbi:hypothetical protein [Glaciecola petra]|uniref:Type II secretion system protein GspC N-terminal domain-containing protein n=1 Tax=Glaciecola petra TaxID=3075602 RepID=A0ABU2ZSK4_9ALTE|nr:hypothetical protein [Aestuariibacter sp. P117]MDT0595617.1 hypothetical protein [Aestuariibacter sp. P117]